MSKRGSRQERQERDDEIVAFIEAQAQEGADQERRRRSRSVAQTVGREAYFLEQLRAALREAMQGLAKPKATVRKPAGKTRRILNLLVSDTHYGSNLDPREVGHRYGAVEEARRTAAVCKAAAEYKHRHRDETELYLHLVGDLIQGQLHDMRDGLPLAEQVAAAIRIWVQGLQYLAANFPRGVTVFCTPGNHGRNTARHRDRAVHQKWDAIETMIYTALKEVAAFIPGVKVVLGYEPKYDFELFDNLGFGTHGDTVINVGYPGKTIDVGGLTKQINSINNARSIKGKKPYKLFIVGHVHIGTTVSLPGGVKVITNGCLVPPDPHAESIGIFEGACGQKMWESTPGHAVGDERFIEVDESTDQDESLDDIIKPFTGL